MPSPALSPSRAADFMQCPLLYRFRVVDRLPEPPSAAAVRGTFVHAVLERLFDRPAHRRTVEDALEILPGTWEDLAVEEPELVTVVGEGDEPTEAELTAWYAQAEALVRTWYTLEDPSRLEPAERELYVEVPIERDEGQGELVMRGYVDRLDIAPADGALRVVDYKTGRSPSPRFEAKALFQMKFYGAAVWRLRGRVPALLQLVYLKDGTILRHAPTEDELRATERKVLAIHDAIEAAWARGDWQPSPSRLCDWCSFKDICPAWGGTPPPLPGVGQASAERDGGATPLEAAEGDSAGEATPE
ncbi:RecB family exonuclease [Kytococcus aerolatus]|nr:PD-(D/E)XK nuclease family protein [Kytococcus aerolatus]